MHIDKIIPYTPFTQVDAFFFLTKNRQMEETEGHITKTTTKGFQCSKRTSQTKNHS